MRQKDQPWIALGISRATWYRLGKPETRPEKKLSRKALLTFAVEQKGGATSVRTMQRIERLQAIDSVPEVRALLELIKAGLMKVGTAERLVFRHLRGSRSRHHPE
jgi:hypothetical protein